MPGFRNNKRSLIKLYAGAVLYRLIAGKYSLGPNSWISTDKTQQLFPDLKSTNLLGSVSFYDAQMNEEKLGAWVIDKAKKSGVKIHENTKVDHFTADAKIFTSSFGVKKFDFIVSFLPQQVRGRNLSLNEINEIETKILSETYSRKPSFYLTYKYQELFYFKSLKEAELSLFLPYSGKTLVGTTEEPQLIDEDIKCSDQERSYLLDIFNKNFSKSVNEQNIVKEFSGLRPIVASKAETKEGYFSSASREAKT